MQASDKSLVEIIQGPKQFLIPIFQRTYNWKEIHCALLYKDIISPRQAGHFIGSIVLISNLETTASIPKWQVIDGQQRLTTITLLIIALLKRANELGMESVSATSLDAIEEYFLTNRFGDGDMHYKLLLTKRDKSSLRALVDKKYDSEDVSDNMKRNFDYFCDQFIDKESIETTYQGLQTLKVVEVLLQINQDDPQAIFESLNSTGVDLSQADLIRNYVLMNQPQDIQTELYENTWFPMEQLFGGFYEKKFDRFAQDFLTLATKSNTLVRAVDVYVLFKQWFSEQINDKPIDEILNNIHNQVRFYTNYSLLQESDNELKNAFSDLKRLIDVATPVIIRLYQLHETDKLSKNDFIKSVRLLESYILRRSVCGMQTRSYGNLFASLAQKITEEKPLESLSVAIARFSKNSRFPNDAEFIESLKNNDLYESANCRLILERIENDSKEKIDTTKFSIEHIMPQNENLRKEWKDMLGDDWQLVHQTWLHRLGNLTLTGYNSEYSDKDYQTKKTINGGFDESPLRLNRDMRESKVWTENEMIARAERLANQSIELWPLLKISSKLISEYALDERKHLSHGKTTSDVDGFKENTTELFSQLKSYIDSIASDASLIIGKKNLTFYTLEPFLQVMPRSGKLAIVMSLEYDQIPIEMQEICSDTHEWSFIVYADLSGVYCEIEQKSDLNKFKELIRLAYEEALS